MNRCIAETETRLLVVLLRGKLQTDNDRISKGKLGITKVKLFSGLVVSLVRTCNFIFK